MTGDKMLVGWNEIATFLRMNRRSAERRGPELDACGVIFDKFSNTAGSSYNVCAYEQKLKDWCALKKAKGEKI